MRELPLGTILRKGDIYQVVDPSSAEDRFNFLVLDEVGPGYQIRRLIRGAGPFEIYPHELPGYRKMGNMSWHKLRGNSLSIERLVEILDGNTEKCFFTIA